MKYIYGLFNIIAKVFILIWNGLSVFFGFTYEQQAKRMKDYDLRGKNNPKRKSPISRANKVSKDVE
jgi:hypothetical protein